MAGALLISCFAASLSHAATQPNVILIMTDDQGYGDLSCHGHPVLKTPEMDALYADSVRLTDFHVDPSCSPTRSSLMTGRYSSRTGVWHTLAGRSIMRRENSGEVDRTLFVHHQRLEEPVKGRNWAAMTRRWRLVDGGQLYDIKNDPKQQVNLAAEHPQVVTRLNRQYDAWWDSISGRFDEFCEVVIGAKEENPVKRTCHDWHSELKLMTWDPAVIEAGKQTNGFWAVDVARSGQYEFRLQMLPDEAIEQRAFGGVRVRLVVGDIEQKKVISPETTSVTLNATLPAGKARMQTWLVNRDETRKGVPFVYAKYAGP
jgi:hypothetical protein